MLCTMYYNDFSTCLLPIGLKTTRSILKTILEIILRHIKKV